MSLIRSPAAQVLGTLHEFDCIIDARSPAEYALDHLPGAVNWPTLDNEQRCTVGTLYAQAGAFEAKKHGAAMAARNIAAHIEREVLDKPKHWKPLIYCWRGGQRSGALALILQQTGFRVTWLEGGYKAFRAAMLQDLARLATDLRLQVICGATGSGKTRLLQSLRSAGAQVIDLEGLANHRSSVLGALPGLAQPTQKRFDTLVWQGLRHMDSRQPVYVESESKKVGNVSVPTALMQAMRQSPCLHLLLPDANRVALLLQDYDYFVRDSALFLERLEVFTSFRGRALVEQWKGQVRAGQFEPVVLDLLQQHYDPGYLQSTRRNFIAFDQARTLTPPHHGPEAMRELAQQLIKDIV